MAAGAWDVVVELDEIEDETVEDDDATDDEEAALVLLELELDVGAAEDSEETTELLDVVTTMEFEVDVTEVVVELTAVVFHAGRVTVLLKS